MNHLKVVARHFSDDKKTNIVFIDDACPSTDGKRIVLPNAINPNYADTVIGSLLHETSHIKYTDFEKTNELVSSKSHFTCLNVLEDIRIDYLTLKEYPNSGFFYRTNIEEVIGDKKSLLLEEPLPIQILKSLIFSAHGYNPRDIYGEEIATRVKPYEKYIAISQGASSTEELIPIAKELSNLLFNELDNPIDDGNSPSDDDDDQKPKGGSGGFPSPDGSGDAEPSDEESGDDDGEGEGNSEGEENSDEDSNNTDGKKKKSRKPSEVNKDCEKAQEKIEKAKKKLAETREKISEKSKENDRAHKNRRANWRKSHNADTDEKREHYKKLAEKHADKQKTSYEEYKKLREELTDARDELNRLDEEIREISDEKKSVENNGFQSNPNAEINGFKSLNRDKLSEKVEDKIESTKTLDEIIAETIIARRDKKFADDSGANLNSREYSSLYTDVEKLFLDEEKKEYKTRVSLILDGSGSMGDIYGGRVPTLLNITGIISDALIKARNHGAPLDFTIYGFSCDVHELVNSDEYVDSDDLKSRYASCEGLGASTNLAKAVNFVAEKMRDDADSDSDLVAIIITDACVSEYELKSLANDSCSHNVRFSFVAIHPDERHSQRDSDEFRFLFGENVIEIDDEESTSVEKLTRIMLELDEN